MSIKTKPISEVIGDLLDTMQETKEEITYEDNVVELFPKKEEDDTIH